jgi:DNA repair protein RadC
MLKHQAGHRERLRKRFLDNPSGLPDYELLELLLGAVVRRGDTKPLAKELLARFCTVRGVLDARAEELLLVPGCGPSLAAYWALLREVLARHAESAAYSRGILCGPAQVAAMARARLGGLGHEEMWAAYLDSRAGLIAFERVAKGSFETTAFHQRDVVGRAWELKAPGIILVHNHPGGDPRPSGSDRQVTAVVRKAAEGMGMQLHDHIIVTNALCYSLQIDDILPG